MNCTCKDWEPNMRAINGPIVLQSIRSGGRYQYTGKQFVYCPWCGKKLKEQPEPPRVGQAASPDSSS